MNAANHPDLSTVSVNKFINQSLALAREAALAARPIDDPVDRAPRPGERAWYEMHQRWVNVHAQLTIFSYVSWSEIRRGSWDEFNALCDDGAQLDEADVPQEMTWFASRFAVVLTADLTEANGECQVMEWPPLDEDFEQIQDAGNAVDLKARRDAAFIEMVRGSRGE